MIGPSRRPKARPYILMPAAAIVFMVSGLVAEN
jgi:hypothetical protein